MYFKVMCATYMYNTKPVEQKLRGASHDGLLSPPNADAGSTPEPKEEL